MTASLTGQLQKLNDSLSEAERVSYRLLLGLAASGLTPDFLQSPATPAKQAFVAVGDCLMQINSYSDRIPPNGVAWRGRPDFVTDELLDSMIRESRGHRGSALLHESEYFLGMGAPIANAFAVSKELCDLVEKHAGKVLPTGIASLLYYDQPGNGITPHIDTDIFSLNVILMLEHQIGQGAPSHLTLYPTHSEPQSMDLAPGEMLILFAGSVTHGREPVKTGEAVTILTLGFVPQAQ